MIYTPYSFRKERLRDSVSFPQRLAWEGYHRAERLDRGWGTESTYMHGMHSYAWLYAQTKDLSLRPKRRDRHPRLRFAACRYEGRRIERPLNDHTCSYICKLSNLASSISRLWEVSRSLLTRSGVCMMLNIIIPSLGVDGKVETQSRVGKVVQNQMARISSISKYAGGGITRIPSPQRKFISTSQALPIYVYSQP